METGQFWDTRTLVLQDAGRWRVVRWPEMTEIKRGQGEVIPEPGGHRLAVHDRKGRIRIVGGDVPRELSLPPDVKPLRTVAWNGNDALLVTGGTFALNPPHAQGPSLLPIPAAGCTAQPFGSIPSNGMSLWHLPLDGNAPACLIQLGGIETIGRAVRLADHRVAFQYYRFPVYGRASMQRIRYWNPSQSTDSSGRDLFSRLPGNMTGCAVSPEGRRLAFLHSDVEPPVVYWYRLALCESAPDTTVTYPLPSTLRLTGRAPTWDPEGRFVAVNAFQGIRIGIVVVDTESGEWEWLGPTDGDYTRVALAPGGKEAVALWESPSTPRGLYRVSTTGRAPITVPSGEANPPEGMRGIDFRLVRWQNGDVALEGVLAVPPGAGPHSLVIDLHGGPLNWSGFARQENLLRWCKAGFAAFAPDYRDSGVGGKEAMLAAARGDDTPPSLSSVYDVLAGVDEIVRMGVADADHLYLFGHSAGGHLVNRIVTVDHRFRAAVCWEGHADPRLGFCLVWGGGGLDYARAMFGGNPWQVPERYQADSALAQVADVRTPLLLLFGDHNGAPYPVADAIVWYTALREHGVETELVFYRGEGHLMERAENREDLFARSIDWFHRH